MCDVVVLSFLAGVLVPVSGHHPSEKKVLCVSAELPTKSFDRPPVTKGGTTAPCPKTHRPIRDSGKPSARDVLLRGLDVRLSGECATSELSGRCVGVLTALPDPTRRQAGLNHGVMLRPRTHPCDAALQGASSCVFYCACRLQ